MNFNFLLSKLEEISKLEECDTNSVNLIQDLTRALTLVPECVDNSKFKVTIAIKKKLGRKPKPVSTEPKPVVVRPKHVYSKEYYEKNKEKICKMMQNRYHTRHEQRVKQLAYRKQLYHLRKESKLTKLPKVANESKEEEQESKQEE